MAVAPFLLLSGFIEYIAKVLVTITECLFIEVACNILGILVYIEHLHFADNRIQFGLTYPTEGESIPNN